ncbi:MAG: hypothetical protein NC489_24920 [Ruminococcus flavefaciens]|nr:hypothetical protein [Ruminococcus flavefaciens]
MADITQRVIVLFAKATPYRAGDMKFLLPEIQFIYGDSLEPNYYKDVDTHAFNYGCNVSSISALPNGWERKLVDVPALYDFDLDFIRDGTNIMGMKLSDLRYVAPIASALACSADAPSSP